MIKSMWRNISCTTNLARSFKKFTAKIKLKKEIQNLGKKMA